MARTKTTEQPTITAAQLADGDWVPVVDVSDTTMSSTGTNKKLAKSQLAEAAGVTAHAAVTSSVHGISAFGATLVGDADAATARSTLGLGTIATQAAGSVAITGGSVTGITDLAVADGGTGGSTAAAALANLTSTTLAADGDILTRSGGAPAPITRANLAADEAFASRYVTLTDTDQDLSTVAADAAFTSQYGPLNESPGVIIPPHNGALVAASETTWFVANYGIGTRFDVDRARWVKGVTLPCGVSSGNIELSIFKVFHTAASTNNELACVKVATSGVVACPSPSSSRIYVPFNAVAKLAAGQYALVLWCDNTTATFVHNLTNANVRSGMCISPSGTSTPGVPDTLFMYYGGRGFLAVVEEAGHVLGSFVGLGDSITQNGQFFYAGQALASRTWTYTNKGTSGEQTSAMAARVATDVVAAAPNYCMFLGGANDIGASRSASATIADMTTIVNACTNAGIKVLIGTITPRWNTALSDPLRGLDPTTARPGIDPAAVAAAADAAKRRETATKALLAAQRAEVPAPPPANLRTHLRAAPDPREVSA